MARKRIIDPCILIDEDLNSLDFMARWMFLGMLVTADDDGRLKGSPLAIKAAILPVDASVTIDAIMAARDQLQDGNLIHLYQDRNGKDLIQVISWWKYQRIDYYSPSHLDAPPVGTMPEGYDTPRGRVEGKAAQRLRLSRGRPGVVPRVSRECPASVPKREERRGEDDVPSGTSCVPSGTLVGVPPTSASWTTEDLGKRWNALAARIGLPQIEKLTKERKVKAAAAISGGLLDRWDEFAAGLVVSKFHCGENDRGWKANFDWLVRPGRWLSVIESAKAPQASVRPFTKSEKTKAEFDRVFGPDEPETMALEAHKLEEAV